MRNITNDELNVVQSGDRCLVNVISPILAKDGKMYQAFLGRCFYCTSFGGFFFRVGEKTNPNFILILEKQVLTIQPCEKILKDDRILVIED